MNSFDYNFAINEDDDIVQDCGGRILTNHCPIRDGRPPVPILEPAVLSYPSKQYAATPPSLFTPYNPEEGYEQANLMGRWRRILMVADKHQGTEKTTTKLNLANRNVQKLASECITRSSERMFTGGSCVQKLTVGGKDKVVFTGDDGVIHLADLGVENNDEEPCCGTAHCPPVIRRDSLVSVTPDPIQKLGKCRTGRIFELTACDALETRQRPVLTARYKHMVSYLKLNEGNTEATDVLTHLWSSPIQGEALSQAYPGPGPTSCILDSGLWMTYFDVSEGRVCGGLDLWSHQSETWENIKKFGWGTIRAGTSYNTIQLGTRKSVSSIDLRSGKIEQTFETDFLEHIRAIRISPHGTHITFDNQLILHDPRTNSRVCSNPLPTESNSFIHNLEILQTNNQTHLLTSTPNAEMTLTVLNWGHDYCKSVSPHLKETILKCRRDGLRTPDFMMKGRLLTDWQRTVEQARKVDNMWLNSHLEFRYNSPFCGSTIYEEGRKIEGRPDLGIISVNAVGDLFHKRLTVHNDPYLGTTAFDPSQESDEIFADSDEEEARCDWHERRLRAWGQAVLDTARTKRTYTERWLATEEPCDEENPSNGSGRNAPSSSKAGLIICEDRDIESVVDNEYASKFRKEYRDLGLELEMRDDLHMEASIFGSTLISQRNNYGKGTVEASIIGIFMKDDATPSESSYATETEGTASENESASEVDSAPSPKLPNEEDPNYTIKAFMDELVGKRDTGIESDNDSLENPFDELPFS